MTDTSEKCPEHILMNWELVETARCIFRYLVRQSIRQYYVWLHQYIWLNDVAIQTIQGSNMKMHLAYQGCTCVLILGCAWPIWTFQKYAWPILTILFWNIGILLGLSGLFRCPILRCSQPPWTIHVPNIRMCLAYPDLSVFQYWDVLCLSGLLRFLILGCARPFQTIHVSNIEIFLDQSWLFRFLILGCLTYSNYSCF
jgi:hypothetical protein